MSYVLVITHENNQQIHRVVLDKDLEIHIGRGWQNDVIVNDEYVDASHLSFSIDADNKLSVTDLNSKNGTRQNKRNLTGTVPYQIGQQLLIGESVISLIDPDTQVAPATKRDTAQKASRAFGSTVWLLIATLMAGAAIVGLSFWTGTTETTSESLVQDGLKFVMSAICWSVVAGFVGKTFRHNTYFKLHWIFACLVVFLATMVTITADIISFNLDTSMAHSILESVSGIAVLGFIVYGALSLSTRMGSTKKSMITCTLALLPTAFALSSAMLAEEHEKWRPSAIVNRINQPPAFLFKAPISIDEHIQNTDALFAALDAQVNTVNRPTAEPSDNIKKQHEAVQLSENQG